MTTLPALTAEQIETTLAQFLEDRFLHVISFTQQELNAAIMAALKTEDYITVEKVVCRNLQTRMDIFMTEDKVYPKNVFFKGMEFRVVPSAAELEKAVVFPGASFIPFVTDELFADEFILTDENGKVIPVIEVTAKYSELVPAFFMLGNSGIIDHLSAESEENRQQLWNTRNPENLDMTLSAFDFSEFYREHSFMDGDALVFTVQDWATAKFTVRVQKEEVTDEAQRNFVRDLEHALLRVCDTDKDYLEIPQQIAEAYLFAYEDGHDLRHRPVLCLSEYRLRMNEIGIRRDGSEWLLVPADDLDTPGTFEQSLLRKRAENDAAMQEHAHEHSHTCSCGHDHTHDHENSKPERTLDPDLDVNNFTISTGTLDSIDAILEELNAPVNSIELGAMIYDAFSNGEENFGGFYARLTASMKLNFADDAQETTFINFLEDNWEICREYYNPAEDAEVRAPLRTRLLELTQSRIEYSMALLERKTSVPEKTVKKLASIHKGILDTLSLLNSDSRLGEQYEQLELRVSDIEDAWDDFLGEN